MDHRELWKTIFGDTDEYIDFYFREKAAWSKIYSKYDGNELVSMAFFTPYEMVYRGRECICPCIVGVATRKEYRHRGYMREILKRGLAEAAGSGSPVAFLSPVNEKIYEPLGFQGVQCRTGLEVTGLRRKYYEVRAFLDLGQDEKERVAEFASKRLRVSGFDLYRKHNVAYYELLQKEMEALGGRVAVLWEGGGIRGIVSYIHEDESYEVTEVICDVCNGQRVVETVCAYVAAGEPARVVFSDGEYLGQVTGARIVRKREKKPYTMLFDLEENGKTGGLHVYINDIT